MICSFSKSIPNKDRKLLEDASEFYLKALNISKSVLNNTMLIFSYVDMDFVASVRKINSGGKYNAFKVFISTRQAEDPVLQSLAHEMVHVKQMLLGELEEEDDDEHAKWNNTTMSINVSIDEYYELPWEKEAYAKEEELYGAYLNGKSN